MINERSSAQPNTPTSANMQYGYQPSHFDMINMQTMQNPNDLYSYYPASLYQPFGTFDDHSQWASTDTTGSVPPPPPPGPIQYHPQMYTPSPLDLPRSPFDYPPPHGYPHYHPGFTPSTFPGPPSAGTSTFDMSWNPHSLSMQQMPVAPQQMTPIGGGPATNKKLSVYDDYPSGGVGDMLAQHMNAVDLGTNTSSDDAHNYDNGANDNSSNINVLSSKDQQQQQQQHYQSNSSNTSLSSRQNQAPQSSVPSGPKSYASVVSADTLNNNKASSPVSNLSLRQTGQSTANERNTNNNNNPTSNFSTDSNNSRSNTNFRGSNNTNNTNNYSQQTRNGTSGFNPRSQQQQQSSFTSGGAFPNWSNNNFPSNSRTGNNSNNNNTNSSSTYYNNASSNYYEHSSYSQQQNSSSNNNNKRQNANYQQNYSSRTANNMSNGNTTASAMGQQPISAANQELLEALKRKHQYNPKDFNLNPKGARFFVIKSYSEDDVHRSIKYNIWCSTEHGNKRLDAAFREREGKGPIYLFFSVNASGHFCGMAEMMSPVDYEHKTDVWQMSGKWQGKFEVKWIYVKDVPNQQFRNIRLENNENKPVTNSRDTQEIPYEKGKLMLKTMHMYRDKTSIFDDFQYYESKQAEEATNLATNHNNNNNSNATNSTSTTKKNSSNDFNNNNTNYSRGNNSSKRQYSANKTSTANQFEQQQQQQTPEDDEDDTNN